VFFGTEYSTARFDCRRKSLRRKYARRDSNPQPSVPKFNERSVKPYSFSTSCFQVFHILPGLGRVWYGYSSEFHAASSHEQSAGLARRHDGPVESVDDRRGKKMIPENGYDLTPEQEEEYRARFAALDIASSVYMARKDEESLETFHRVVRRWQAFWERVRSSRPRVEAPPRRTSA